MNGPVGVKHGAAFAISDERNLWPKRYTDGLSLGGQLGMHLS